MPAASSITPITNLALTPLVKRLARSLSLTHTHTHTLSLSPSPAGGRAINNRQSASPYSPASQLPSISNSHADSPSAIQRVWVRSSKFAFEVHKYCVMAPGNYPSSPPPTQNLSTKFLSSATSKAYTTKVNPSPTPLHSRSPGALRLP